MASRLPSLNDVAPSSALESSSSVSTAPAPAPAPASATVSVSATASIPLTSNPSSILSTPNQDPECVKQEASPTPSGFTSADGETPVADNHGGSTTAAGRKRKLNSTSSRGVANLTPEQLAKKRANDRQAQRAIRERTKSHIESLEQRVRELSSQKPFLDLQAALKRNEAIQAENRDLKHGLKAVMDIIQPLVAKQDPNLPPPPPPHAAAPPSSCQPLNTPFNPLQYAETHHFTSTGQRYESSYTASTSGAETPTSTHSAPTMSAHRQDSSNGLASFRIAFDYQRHNLAHGLDFGTDERLGFNFLLDTTQQVPRVQGFRSSTESFRPCQADPPPVYTPSPSSPAPEQPLPAYRTPIRNIAPTCTLDAILLDFLHQRQRKAAEGVPTQKLVGPPYPSVSSLLNPDKSVYSHPLSKVFVDILRAFPDISSLPEQVAVLYAMFLLMRWQIYPTPENYERLPDWLTPRPSQLLTPHPAWIDYLPWPRMRDRLVGSYQDYPFDQWFIPFTRTLSVNWPYEATDCLLSTSDHEDLIINPVFERHLRNLNNWSLGPAFAEAHPQMAETARIKS
ncbi:probable GTP cyclohydrolase-2 [Aspergillus udagawae]|nr:probable GTP cyclohydrolase-2 [Aspergillus udagawae]GFG21840.1 probable GTP cyclohydrolase-2 [Aspergillus udagawae]